MGIRFPHSLGLLYSAFTYYTGFKVNSGEYKLMGLAPYGEPKYAGLIRDQLVDLKDGRHFPSRTCEYFNYPRRPDDDQCARSTQLFGGPPRAARDPLTQREMDIAASIQAVTEEIVLRLGRTLHRETGAANLCLAGGVALNCVANGRLLREGPFRDIWIQPAAGDAGGALGAALCAWHEHLGEPPRAGRRATPCGARSSAPRTRASETRSGPRRASAPCTSGSRTPGSLRAVAERLAAGDVVGWFQGRMEFGPRALGARSILGDPRSPQMQAIDEPEDQVPRIFRPFAPAVLAERVADGSSSTAESPYMLLVAPVTAAKRRTHDRGRGAALRHRQAERRALGDPRGHARRLLGADPDGATAPPTRCSTR